MKVFKLFGPEYSKAECPSCKKEIADQQEQETAARAERDRQRRVSARIEGYLSRAGVPIRFNGKTFADYVPPTDRAKAVHRVCIDYATRFPEYAEMGAGITMTGLTGTGKSHLAAAIAQHVITEHQKLAVYMTAGRAFRMVKDTYGKNSTRTEQEVYDFLCEPDLLILDEIGVQHGSDTEKNIIFEIVNERYEATKPTILISNLNMVELTADVGARVVDRMRENGGKLMFFDWDSHRIRKE